MNILITALLLASFFAGLVQGPRVSAEDLDRLAGAQWKGTLTYKDYGSGKQVSIPSRLTVTRAEGGWVFEYEYPEEPKANGKQTVTLEEGGRVLNGAKVVGRQTLQGGVLIITTEKRGKDDDREALFRYTYVFGESSFSVGKYVKPEGAAEFFERNVYSWER